MNPQQIDALWATVGAMFILAVVGLASAWLNAHAIELEREAHVRELATVKKVGKWYEARTKELETENQLLAAQVIEAGRPPIKAVAMPSWGPDGNMEYAYDDTGLVREVLDPRDLGPSSVT